MFKEILQIIPKLSNGDLNAMERSLSRRFTNVAKKFGKGLGAALKGGGIAGIAVGLIDKLLNPLKETQDAIDRFLESADSTSTAAVRFGTKSGNLAKLQTLGVATGLDPASLETLMTKYQVALAEAKADPSKPTSVRKFADDTDIAASFYEFVQSMKALPINDQLLVQKEVFGEKQIGKFADFLQTDLDALFVKLGGPSAKQLTRYTERGAGLSDEADFLKAKRFQEDIVGKGQIITSGMMKSRDEQLRQDMSKENMNIKAYQDLADISMTVAGLVTAVQGITTSLAATTSKFYGITESLKKIADSPALKGIIRFIKAE